MPTEGVCTASSCCPLRLSRHSPSRAPPRPREAPALRPPGGPPGARPVSGLRRRRRRAFTRAGLTAFQKRAGLLPARRSLLPPAARLDRSDAPPRPARARRGCGGLGRLVARVQARPVRPPSDAGRRAVHGGDGQGSRTVPGAAGTAAGRDCREADVRHSEVQAAAPLRSHRPCARPISWWPARASSRSPSATGSARCCSPERAGSSSPP